MMSGVYASYPAGGGGGGGGGASFEAYPTFSAFPTSALDGSLAIALDTDILYYAVTSASSSVLTIQMDNTSHSFPSQVFFCNVIPGGSYSQTGLNIQLSQFNTNQTFFISNNTTGSVHLDGYDTGGNQIYLSGPANYILTLNNPADSTATGLTVTTTSNTVAWLPLLPVQTIQADTGNPNQNITNAPSGNMLAKRDSNGNVWANQFINAYTTTATAAGTTTLTSASTCLQYFTGSTTQTVVLPVTSTLSTGFQFQIVNNSSGVVTVESSGSNSIQAMAASTSATFTCILTSGTSAASWNVAYLPPPVATATLQSAYAAGNVINTTGSSPFTYQGSSAFRLNNIGGVTITPASAPSGPCLTVDASGGVSGTVGLNIIGSGGTGAALVSGGITQIGATSTTPQHILNTATATIGAGVLTLTNAPSGRSGNPAGYIEITINGSTAYLPYWS